METTYKLRPGLAWHDGQPLTAEDFVFAWRVYRSDLPFSSRPQDKMGNVAAPDPRTLTIRWSSLEVTAGRLETEFEPLPSHLLSESFQAFAEGSMTTEAFLGNPFWTQAYVGAGAWRLTRWERGAFIEGSAFDGYALGRPKIDRVIVRVIGDENTILANLLAGEIDYAQTLVLRFEHGDVLSRDWVPSGKGKFEIGPQYFVMNIYQFRPEFQSEPALFDVRARRAMVHALDRQALADAMFQGAVPAADTWAYRHTPYFVDVERTVAKYPYDVRRSQQLLEEVGLRRGADGFFVNPDGRRFEPDFQVRAGSQQERGQAIQIDMWKSAGVQVTASVLPNIAVPASERHNVPGFVLRTSNIENWWRDFLTSEIGSPANRWRGENRTGWSNAEYDRLFEVFDRTLDPREADRITVQMLKVVHDEVPGYVVYDSPALIAYAANLRGPSFPVKGEPAESQFGKLHEWEFVR
jgi:peptide/nickel transport system substrate-binding protein